MVITDMVVITDITARSSLSQPTISEHTSPCTSRTALGDCARDCTSDDGISDDYISDDCTSDVWRVSRTVLADTCSPAHRASRLLRPPPIHPLLDCVLEHTGSQLCVSVSASSSAIELQKPRQPSAHSCAEYVRLQGCVCVGVEGVFIITAITIRRLQSLPSWACVRRR
jgi:hypothetical protein